MKYKGVELIHGENREDELLCAVEFNNPDEDDELIDEMVDDLYDILYDVRLHHRIYVEPVMDNYICVTCNRDITFDEKGINLLKKIYDIINNSHLNCKVTVNIHANDFSFTREDGTTYNEDEATWEEFIKNLEY